MTVYRDDCRFCGKRFKGNIEVQVYLKVTHHEKNECPKRPKK